MEFTLTNEEMVVVKKVIFYMELRSDRKISTREAISKIFVSADIMVSNELDLYLKENPQK